MNSTSEILQLVSLIPARKEDDAPHIFVPDGFAPSPLFLPCAHTASVRRLSRGARPTALDLMLALQRAPNLSFVGEIKVSLELDLDYVDEPRVPIDVSLKDKELEIQRRLARLETEYEARVAGIQARIDAQIEMLSKEVEEILAMQEEVDAFKRVVLAQRQGLVQYVRMLRAQPSRVAAFFTHFYQMLVAFFLMMRAKIT